MPQLGLVVGLKKKVGRFFKGNHHNHHGKKKIAAWNSRGSSSGNSRSNPSFEDATDQTLRLSESEISLLSTSTPNDNENDTFMIITPSPSPSSSFDQLHDEKTTTETATATASEPLNKKKKRPSVSFSHVQVREYELILGDNPGIRYPLSIGWNYQSEEHQDVDTYEEQRAAKTKQAKEQDRIFPRLYVPPHELPPEDPHEDGDDGLLEELTLYERRMRLRAFGYSEAYLRTQERQRQCRTALEWAWGGAGGPRFPHCDAFIQRYSRE